MLAAVAFMATSCEKTEGSEEESTYTLSGDKFIGTLDVMSATQEDVVFYIDVEGENLDIMMPEVSFMSGLMPNLDMALITIPQISEDPDTYYTESSQMVVIYDRLPLINDVVQSISNVSVVRSGYSVYVSFDCAISISMGDMTVTVTYEGVEEGYEPEPEVEPEFTLDNDEGFYITNSYGEQLLPDAAITYYEGDNTLVIEGFTFVSSLETTTLPITSLSVSEAGGLTTITGDGIDVEYLFMTMDATGVISGLTCEIIDGIAQLEFSISASMGGSAPASDYPCTYSGAITVESSSYVVE